MNGTKLNPALSLMPFRVRQPEWETSRMPIPDSRFPRPVSAQRSQPFVIRAFVDAFEQKGGKVAFAGVRQHGQDHAALRGVADDL